jgi:hypothetical protein
MFGDKTIFLNIIDLRNKSKIKKARGHETHGLKYGNANKSNYSQPHPMLSKDTDDLENVWNVLAPLSKFTVNVLPSSENLNGNLDVLLFVRHVRPPEMRALAPQVVQHRVKKILRHIRAARPVRVRKPVPAGRGRAPERGQRPAVQPQRVAHVVKT